MTTPLHSTLKRALTIDVRDYVVTLTDTSLKLTLKGKRNGFEMEWTQMVNGEAALAVALQASVGAFVAKNAATPTAARKASTQKRPVAKRPPAKPPTVRPPTATRPSHKAPTAKRPAAQSRRPARGTRKG